MNCIALVLSGSVSVDFLVERRVLFSASRQAESCSLSCPHPTLPFGHAAACPTGGRGSASSDPLKAGPPGSPCSFLPPLPVLRAGALFSAPGGGGQWVTRQPCPPLLARQCGVQPSGGQAPPSVQSHRRTRRVRRAALQARLRVGLPLYFFPCSRAPVVLRLPFLPRERCCGTGSCLRDVCEDAPLPSRELLSSDAMKRSTAGRGSTWTRTTSPRSSSAWRAPPRRGAAHPGHERPGAEPHVASGGPQTPAAGLMAKGCARWGTGGRLGAAGLGGPSGGGWRRQLVRGWGLGPSGTDAVASARRACPLSVPRLSHSPVAVSWDAPVLSLSAAARSHLSWLQPDGWRGEESVRGGGAWGLKRAPAVLLPAPLEVYLKKGFLNLQRKAETCIRAFPSLSSFPGGAAVVQTGCV